MDRSSCRSIRPTYDANKHARRIHWALDAALRHPPGGEREALYLEHYVRDFGGRLPYWAK